MRPYECGTEECSKCRKQRESEGGVCCASGCPGTSVCAHCILTEAERAVRTSYNSQRFLGMRCVKHEKQVVTARLAGLKLFFDFRCLLCRNSRRTAIGQYEDLAEDDEVPVSLPTSEGDEVVVCPNPRCRLALCIECARWLQNQRTVASSAGVLSETLPGYTLDLSLEHTRKPFRCNVCGEYHDPPRRPDRLLVFLHDLQAGRCASNNSLGTPSIVDEMKRHAGVLMLGCDTGDGEHRFGAFHRWKKFAIKQQGKYEKNLPTRSIMETAELSLTPRAFHELELKVHTPLITLAIDADCHPFLSHRSVQVAVMRKWLSPIRLDLDTSPETFLTSRAHVTRPDKSHTSKEDFFMFSPKTSFQMYSISYLLFTALVSYTSLVSCERGFTWNEILIAIWVAGFIRIEVYQLSTMFLDYFRSFWNVFDILLLLAYVAALGIKLAVRSTTPGEYRERVLLETHECILAVAVFMTYMHGLYVCRPNAHLGPILVSFGSMIGNVLVWFSVAMTVIVAISLAMLKLYVSVSVGANSSSGSAAAGSSSLPAQSAALSENSSLALSSEASVLGQIGANFVTVFTSLVWGMTNMPYFDGTSYADLNQGALTSGRRVFSQIIVTIFMILVTIVLINLLIAVMNTTYSNVTSESAEEHKVSFVGVVEEFAVTPPVPPPLNLVLLLFSALAKAGYAAAARLAGLCCSAGSTLFCPQFLRPRDLLSPWARGPVLSGVQMHTKYYMHLKRLHMAMTAEASVEGKLKQWLNSGSLGVSAETTLADEVSGDLDRLNEIATRLTRGRATQTAGGANIQDSL
eukprot:m51a1_g1385 hypothetical protein (801) ;mRNA; r:455928-459081